jgi:hypothetical protein
MKNDQNSNLKFDRKGVAFKVAQPPTSVTVLGVHILAPDGCTIHFKKNKIEHFLFYRRLSVLQRGLFLQSVF